MLNVHAWARSETEISIPKQINYTNHLEMRSENSQSRSHS